MSRRRKSKKSSSRRRRVSGVNANGLTDVAGIAGGFVGGNFISTKVAAQLASVDPKIIAGGLTVLGLIVSKKGKGIISSAGKGVAVSGVYALLRELAPSVVSGIGAPDLVTFNNNSLRGFPEPSLIGTTGPNFNEMSVIGGIYNSAYAGR